MLKKDLNINTLKIRMYSLEVYLMDVWLRTWEDWDGAENKWLSKWV